MSGGVDSSVTAALLKRQGHEVSGVFMKLWGASGKDEIRARKVAEILDIPFYVFNFEKEFKKRVVDYFLKEYKAERTPNPCVVCNKEIKFGLLIEKVLKLGADYVATGHYACLRQEILNPKSEILNYQHRLLKGRDKKKDQSYFLWKLNQKQLKHILFPVGEYTKVQVRKLAKKFKLPVLDVSESQEICFIPTTERGVSRAQGEDETKSHRLTLNNFLAQYIKTKPGQIVDINGKILGQHQGLLFYTIGQRKGIELSGGPFYVVEKNLKRNNLIVAQFFNNKNLYKKSLFAKDVNWVSGKEPKFPLKIKAQIRYRHKAVPATIAKKLKGRKGDETSSHLHLRPPAASSAGDETSSHLLSSFSTSHFAQVIELVFIKSQRAITPGQSVVFYLRDELLGGGIII